MIHVDSPNFDFILKDIISISKVLVEPCFSGAEKVYIILEMKHLTISFSSYHHLTEDVNEAKKRLNILREFLLMFMVIENSDKNVNARLVINKDHTYTFKQK